ncbi:MAG: alpha-L-rhamnosidase N-terminal domain-containing protein [Rhodopirellula sp. JB044]|uniref:alpha-L-rhamnosidase-related protein n=1 Tax=Rhodopirellula sp. JB044 TaxID=3342844 RepID=UPI00370B9AB0
MSIRFTPLVLSLTLPILLALNLFNVQEVHADKGTIDWNAQWIWQQQDGPANAWVAFRKTVNIDDVPEKVVASVSADSKYWMWINGELAVFEGSVARGPSPAKAWKRVKEIWLAPPEDKPSNSWYEDVDITEHLKSGENTIAVLVWYWGAETHKGTHIDSGKGGFILQADLGKETLVTDQSWKVKANPAYALDSGDTGTSIIQYNVQYDARKAMEDWQSADFDDADWAAATQKGMPPTAPWYELVKNYVPPLVNHGLQFYTSHPESKFPFSSDGQPINAVLPFNQQITPWLEVECKAGLEIKITTDDPHNKISAFYTTKEGRQSFEAYSWMNGHRVTYDIPAGVKVLGLKYRWMSVGEMAGSFACSDPFYDRLWQMGRNTLFVCARDNFMDCPDRERACWIGDVADQSSYLFYCMDNSGRKLLKKAIRTTMAYSHEGIYAALGPLRLRELPSQSLQFVDQGVWQYYFNTGDIETLRYAYPYVRQYLKLWNPGEDGLQVRKKPSMDHWNWSDWGQKDTIDQQIVIDSLYFMALNSAVKMANELGEPGDLAWYQKRIDAMKAGFDKKYWTGEYYSSRPGKLQDDRANCLTILSGIAPKDKHASIVRNVLIPNHFCSPHFEWMVEDAMCQAGFHEAALQRMKQRYQSQVDREWQTTLYEKFPKGGTYNHAWNAPNAILAKHIAGIVPTQPGWREFRITPTLLHMTSLDQVIPSVVGDISVSMQRDDSTFSINLKSPEGTTAIVGIPKSVGDIHNVRVNDQIIWKDGKFTGDKSKIEFAGEDKEFIKFKLGSGQWDIVSTTANEH